MSLTMSEIHQPSIGSSSLKRPSTPSKSLNISSNQKYKFEFVNSKIISSSSNGTHAHSTNGRSASRSPKTHYHPYDARGRPAVFGAPSILCGIKESDALVPDVLRPKVERFPYPKTPILSTYDSTGALIDEKGALEAFEIAKAAHFTIQAHETVVQAKIQEQILILQVLQRQAEELSTSSREAQRQVGEIAGMLRQQGIFPPKRVGNVGPINQEISGEQSSSDGEQLSVDPSSRAELNISLSSSSARLNIAAELYSVGRWSKNENG